MSTAQNSRVACWLECAALALAALFLCVHSLPRAWKTLNTDFPNYYIAAQLVHQGYDTSRMYEWQWIEREKDHRAIDDRVIGLLPITPFSTLAMLPLTTLKPLAAKHIWILLNLAFLFPISWMLRWMTGLSYRRIALVILVSFPMYRNLLYGQFYIFLLLLLTAACFSYLRGYRALAGVLVAIAAACKIFPLLLFVFFLRRRDWRALASGVITATLAVAVSIAVFGLNAHRTWFQEILPWVMRGEGLGTYTVTASISGVLHCLFLYEPQWNPHPWHSSPFCYAMLAPVLQMLVLAPAILLIRREDKSDDRVLLEWSGLLTASLAISTIPASYNFVLMVFPVCVLGARLLRRKSYGWLAALIIAYLGIGFPLPVPASAPGLSILLYVPRLPLMLAVLVGIYGLLWKNGSVKEGSHDWGRYAWAATMLVSVIFSVQSTLYVERAQRLEFSYRLPLQKQGYLNGQPQVASSGVRYVAFTLDGYRLIAEPQSNALANPTADTPYDDLSFTGNFGRIFMERASGHGSQIVDARSPSNFIVDDGHDPMLSADGRNLAFLHEDHGRNQLLIRRGFESDHASEAPLTPLHLNIYEGSFLSESKYAFAAADEGHAPRIYLTDTVNTNVSIGLENSRYPALSPDGRWMAYSHLSSGVWNLWLRDQVSGATRRIADVPCNQIQPAWENDSKTLLYDTDCGRSIWFTAVARRQVVP